MTKKEKDAITNFRINGRSYQEIANILNIKREAVRSFCRTHNIAPNDGINIPLNKLCPVCGKRLEDSSKRGRKRRFCSDDCRTSWWKSHHRELGHDITRMKVYRCMNCGRTFRGYESIERKYCCHECYISHRFNSSKSLLNI